LRGGPSFRDDMNVLRLGGKAGLCQAAESRDRKGENDITIPSRRLWVEGQRSSSFAKSKEAPA